MQLLCSRTAQPLQWLWKVIEWAGLEGISKLILFQPLLWAGMSLPGPGCSGPRPSWLWRWIFLLGWCQIQLCRLQKARSRGVPAGELSSSGAFCSLQHLPNGRHHAELPGIPGYDWNMCDFEPQQRRPFLWTLTVQHLESSCCLTALTLTCRVQWAQGLAPWNFCPDSFTVSGIWYLANILWWGGSMKEQQPLLTECGVVGVPLVHDAAANEGISTIPQLVVSVKVHSSWYFYANISNRNWGVCIWPLKLRAKLQRATWTQEIDMCNYETLSKGVHGN